MPDGPGTARSGAAGSGVGRWVGRTGSEALGWVLLLVGFVLWPLPGPGTLVVVAAIALLARRYTWAQRLLGPLRRRAVEAAKFGVATWPRIGLSLLGVLWLVALGAVWAADPTISTFTVLGVGFGPRLPAAGWVTATGLWASAAVALGLLVHSIRRWRPQAEVAPERPV